MLGYQMKVMRRSNTGNRTRTTLVRCVDFACLVAAYTITTIVAARIARVGMFVWPAPAASDILGWPAQYVVLFLIAVTAWNAVGAYLGIYQSGDRHGPTNPAALSRAACLWAAAIAVAVFLFKLPYVSRAFVLSFVLLGFTLIALRGRLERALDRLSYGGQLRVAIVVGSGAQAEWLIDYLRRHFLPNPYASVRRPATDDEIRTRTDAVQTAHASNGASRMRTSFDVFMVAADMSEDVCSLIPQLLKRGVKTHIIPAVFDTSIFRLALSDIGGVPLVTVRGGEIDPLEAVLKRVIDFSGALLMLTLAAPLMLIVAVLVKITSPGPVIFWQERLGKNGRRMRIYKFRTMRSDAEKVLKANQQLYNEYVENNYKLPQDRDPRITPLGRILRQTSIDELPQLINVLKGEMSLVGPRPIVPDEIKEYGDCAPLLLSVQPGLTGQWQVSGRSSIADYAQRVKLDMEYLRDQSVATDLRILLRTLPAVVSRQGAH